MGGATWLCHLGWLSPLSLGSPPPTFHLCQRCAAGPETADSYLPTGRSCHLVPRPIGIIQSFSLAGVKALS